MKTLFIEKMDKPFMAIQKIKIEQDSCKICLNLEKEKNVKKLIKKLEKNEVIGVVLSKEFYESKNLINALKANGINIFNGRWLEKYLAIQILDYIVMQKNIKKEETEIAITVNQITDLSIELIRKIAKQYKRVTVVTNHIEKLRKIEKEIYDKDGILIVISNNQKKSLSKTQIILNIDFNKEVLNRYRIYENAIIINLEGDMRINDKRFNGININDYEIEVGREDVIWRPNISSFKAKDLLEASLYMKDTFESICSRISKNKVNIKELYGINGTVTK